MPGILWQMPIDDCSCMQELLLFLRAKMGGIHLLANYTGEAQANQHAEIESNDLIAIRMISRAN